MNQSRISLSLLTELFCRKPGRLTSIILAVLGILFSPLCNALTWESHPGYRSAALPVAAAGKAGFTLLSGAEIGVVFTNRVSAEAEASNQNLLNGAGLALGDYDQDGWCDIFLCNLQGSSALFRNLGGLRFTNVTAEAGLA